MQMNVDDITNQQLLEALTEQLGVITDNMATKDDLKEVESRLEVRMATKEELRSLEARLESRMATKDDLKRFATKDDLKAFVTKDDLKVFATKDDLKAFATKDDLQSLGTRLDVRMMQLERRLASSHTVNIKHHLETRKAIGDLNRRHEAGR